MMLRLCAGLSLMFVLLLSTWSPLRGDALPDVQQRLLGDIKFLASDDLEGRGVGTNGLNTAAEYIKREFANAGLAVDRVNGDAFQRFNIVTGSKLVDPHSLRLVGPEGKAIELKIGGEAEVCSFAGSGTFDGNVVFCGYGIDTTADAHGGEAAKDVGEFQYNDFAGVDVEGKVVIFLRRNPRQSDPKSPLGAEHGISRYAELRTKMQQAAAHKVAAVLFVNDPYAVKKAGETRRDQSQQANEKVVVAAEEFLAVDAADADKLSAARARLTETVNQSRALRQASEKPNDDQLMKFGYGGNGDSTLPPAFHISINTCNELLASAKTDLAKLESEIDSDLKPRSFDVAGWKATGTATIEKTRADVANVIGVIDGQGPFANETVIIGAHYDHVGRGGQNSLAPGSAEIHNGADDNASGTIALLELARRFGEQAKAQPPARRLVFIAFTGEEMGLLGSAHYCKEPVYPLDQTVAMLNMDMVGRLNEQKLIVYGTGTSSRWEPELNRFNANSAFKLVFKPEGFGPSDHSSFYAKKIPVLHMFTGEHADYHRPTDDWEKINIEGVARVVDLMEHLIRQTSEQPDRPDYIEVKGTGGPIRNGNRPYVGTVPEFGNEQPGYAISGVVPGSPGDKGGLKAGDRIVKLGMHNVANLDDFDAALRRFAAGDTVDVVVVRGSEEVSLKITLAPPR